jgi:hypothetical protein
MDIHCKGRRREGNNTVAFVRFYQCSCMRRLSKIGALYARLGRLSEDAADEDMLAIHVSLDADRSSERCHSLLS